MDPSTQPKRKRGETPTKEAIGTGDLLPSQTLTENEAKSTTSAGPPKKIKIHFGSSTGPSGANSASKEPVAAKPSGIEAKLETLSKTTTTSPVEPAKKLDEDKKELTPFEKAKAEALSKVKPGETAVVNDARLLSIPKGFQEKYLGEIFSLWPETVVLDIRIQTEN
jgi:hypothetical protein